jgi:hypothetical protein
MESEFLSLVLAVGLADEPQRNSQKKAWRLFTLSISSKNVSMS